jgi:hypothetical protein
MTAMANVTVKKNDGTTDQIWTGVQSAGGDKSPAIWHNASVGSAPAFFPRMSMVARSNAELTVRRLDLNYAWYQSVVGTDGIYRKANTYGFQGHFVIPQGMPDADRNEAASQLTNLIDSALFLECLKSGWPPVS